MARSLKLSFSLSLSVDLDVDVSHRPLSRDPHSPSLPLQTTKTNKNGGKKQQAGGAGPQGGGLLGQSPADPPVQRRRDRPPRPRVRLGDPRGRGGAPAGRRCGQGPEAADGVDGEGVGPRVREDRRLQAAGTRYDEERFFFFFFFFRFLLLLFPSRNAANHKPSFPIVRSSLSHPGGRPRSQHPRRTR